jgi:hypothetical protein
VSRRNPRDGAPYLVESFALTAVPDHVCPWKETDLKAWRSLQRVPDLNKRAALAIVRAMIGSVAAPELQPGVLRAVDFSRGPLDLQPHMCRAEGEQLLLAMIADPLIVATGQTELPEWHITHRHQIADLPAEFRRQFLWGLHLSPWARVERTLAYYEELGLAADAGLCAAVARLLTLTDRDVGLAWLEILAATPGEQRAATACEIMESGKVREMPEAASVAVTLSGQR